MILAVLAGVAFGGFFVMLSRTHASAGLWPLLSARVVSIGLLGGVLAAHRPGRCARRRAAAG